MSDYVIPPAPQVVVTVQESKKLFPVRRIYCVGRNYAAHVREMGGDEREPPFFFQKPANAIVADGQVVPYPPATQDLHHEVELVLAIGGRGHDVSIAQAGQLVFGTAVGIDLTRRDLQAKAREAGRPWEPGKSFDHSAPISAIKPRGNADLPGSGKIQLSVNGVVRQQGDLRQMIWSCAEIISELSKLFELAPGDLIYTGTPSGVGPVRRGDLLEGSVDAVGSLRVNIG
jgi:fumarylpyruvate hydrolase